MLFVATGCTTAASSSPIVAPATEPAAATDTTLAAAPTTTTAAPTTTAPPAPPARRVVEQAWTPFATVGGITLHHVSARTEHVGFHQSNHEGAQEMTPLPSAAAPFVLESRERLTGPHSAADLVVDPEVEIRSPVTGTVKRAGGYTLYCKYTDDFLVVAPDANPAWEVKVLHISGVQVRAGDRVEAGVTVVAPRPTPLPFESQIDEHRTADPAWPHVHLEVVDPSIPNVANGGSGGC